MSAEEAHTVYGWEDVTIAPARFELAYTGPKPVVLGR